MLTKDSVEPEMNKDLNVGSRVEEIIKNAYSNIGKSRKEKFKVAEAKGYLETKELLKEAQEAIQETS